MSASYRAGVQEHLPSATITFDEFHVVQLLTKAADEVRRAEVKQLLELKRSRYLWLKDKRNLITIAYLVAGRLTHPPASPFGQYHKRISSNHLT